MTIEKTVTRAFDRQWLIEEDVPFSDLVVFEENVGSINSWQDGIDCVFRNPDDGFLYLLPYPVGKTELQEVDWYDEFPAVVNLCRVNLVEKIILVKGWELVHE